MSKLLLVTAAALAAGCTAVADPRIAVGADPTDPRSPVPRAAAIGVMNGFTAYRPVSPGDWRDLNRRVAPPGALPPRP